jgi:ATP-dependent DNA helicase RecQ
MYADSFVINLENYLQRKKNFEVRVKAMVDYIMNTVNCRSKTIAAYFNDINVKACGICDNCINQKTIQISTEEFEQITAFIFDFANGNSTGIKELLNRGKIFRKEKLWKVIDFLQAEKKLSISKEGIVEIVYP